MTDSNVEVPTSMIEQLATEFDELCNSRMQFGQEKYGEFTWLSAPTIEMMLEEMADWVNYTRMSAVKIRIMQQWLEGKLAGANDTGFVPSNPDRQ
jgi:hypothetical protein